MTSKPFAHIEGPPLTREHEVLGIGNAPAVGAQRHPSRAALIFPDRGTQMTYRQLDECCDTFVAFMRTRGLRAGDRIAYLGRNSDLFVPALFGSIRGGFVLTPLNWRLTAPELAFQLGDSHARMVLCDTEFLGTVTRAIEPLQPKPNIIQTETPVANAESLRSGLSRPAPETPPAHTAGQVILQLYTSGTTGRPKGVLITHRALSLSRHAELISADFDHLGKGAMSLSAMPNFHIGGISWLLMGLVRLGTTVLTADPSAGNLLRLMREYNIAHSFIVPTVIRSIVDALKAAGEEAPRLKGIFYGGMPMSESLLQESLHLFRSCAFLQFFGMTEISGSAAYLAPADHDPARPSLLKSVGKPYPGTAIEIRGLERQVLATGQHGEIWIRSPSLMQGYWQQPEKTQEVVSDGWYASGDGGYIDDDGYLYLTDRIKDMIVSGGENVYPVEVEEALRQHPAVLEAAVVGRPDERWGEIVIAVVEPRPGQSVDDTELRAFARNRIAGYKCPKAFYVVSALPRTSSGKVKRAELRAQVVAGYLKP
jgi:acyl-CoA synthetase (AMP-forming)/AMP-acid ligase II